MSAQQHPLASYTGELVNGRMHGQGTYWFESGTRFVGEFRDGLFHGKGTFYFNDGGRYEGEWENGVEKNGEYIFSSGLVYNEEKWDYCNESTDRRFYPELINGLNPADRCLLSEECDLETGKPLRFVPKYWYDCGDGVYDPSRRAVFEYGTDEINPHGEFLRNATEDEHKWITTSCRKGWDEPVGCQENIKNE